MCSSLRFVTPAARSALNAGRMLGHSLQGQQPQYITMVFPRGAVRAHFVSAAQSFLGPSRAKVESPGNVPGLVKKIETHVNDDRLLSAFGEGRRKVTDLDEVRGLPGFGARAACGSCSRCRAQSHRKRRKQNPRPSEPATAWSCRLCIHPHRDLQLLKVLAKRISFVTATSLSLCWQFEGQSAGLHKLPEGRRLLALGWLFAQPPRQSEQVGRAVHVRDRLEN